jgi:hypothetical protein
VRRGRETSVHEPGPAVERWGEHELRRFASALLLSGFALFVCVVGFNAIVDPYGTLGTGLFSTAVPNDPRAKALLIAHMDEPPQLLVLGSSRSMGMPPEYVQRRTGLRAFNAGIRSGTALDAYAMVRWAHDRAPGVRRRYIWMLDDAAFSLAYVPGQLAGAQGLNEYFRPSERRSAKQPSLWRLLSLRAVQDSWNVVWASVRHRHPSRFDADGSWRGASGEDDLLAAGGDTLAARLRSSLATLRVSLGRPTSQLQLHYFERTLALMKRWGERPVLVLSPVHPALLRAVGAIGWNRRHRALLAYLRGLQRRYRFTLLDMSSIRSFGGTPSSFKDGTHMGRRNFELMVDEVVRRSGDALH